MQPSVRQSHTMLNREYDQICSIARTLEVLGERWTLLVIRDVFNGQPALRPDPGEPRRRPQRALRPGSRWLVEEGILEKRAYQERPPRYEYFLTEKGLDLWPVMISMLHWGDRHLAEPDGPPMLIRHKGCDGARRRPRLLRALRRAAHRPRRLHRVRPRRAGRVARGRRRAKLSRRLGLPAHQTSSGCCATRSATSPATRSRRSPRSSTGPSRSPTSSSRRWASSA